MNRLSRIARAFLDSRIFAIIAQSNFLWSILRFLPRSMREYTKDISHAALHAPKASFPILESETEKWRGDAPLLSVIVPCYNYGRYIREALQSIRSQTFRDCEIIVVDDGSTDLQTIQVLKGLRREGLRVLRQEHSGPAQALNRGISLATGRYICCLSSDDTIEPTYFEKCLALLESNPGLSFAYPLVRTFGFEQRVGVTKPFDLGLLLSYNHVCGSAIFRKAGWEAVAGFDPAMSAYEDWDFWIRLGKAGFRGRLISEPLFNWRRHQQTFGRRVDKRRPELLARIRATHADIFSNPRQIERIQREYRDYRVPDPFLNLSSKNQYLQYHSPVVLTVMSGVRLPEQVYNFLSGLHGKRGTIITVTTTSVVTKSAPSVSSSITYNLTSFLEPYYWPDFVINLISTRCIPFVVICDSELSYEWSTQIKAQTSARVYEPQGLPINTGTS